MACWIIDNRLLIILLHEASDIRNSCGRIAPKFNTGSCSRRRLGNLLVGGVFVVYEAARATAVLLPTQLEVVFPFFFWPTAWGGVIVSDTVLHVSSLVGSCLRRVVLVQEKCNFSIRHNAMGTYMENEVFIDVPIQISPSYAILPDFTLPHGRRLERISRSPPVSYHLRQLGL